MTIAAALPFSPKLGKGKSLSSARICSGFLDNDMHRLAIKLTDEDIGVALMTSRACEQCSVVAQGLDNENLVVKHKKAVYED